MYDCGAVVGKSLDGPTPELKMSIDNSGLEKVDFVVISHLDKDHINGLIYLEDYLKKVSAYLEDGYESPRIILPKPSRKDLLFFFKTVPKNILQYYYDRILGDNRTIYVSDEDMYSDVDVWLGEKSQGGTYSHLFNFHLGSSKDSFWMLKFFVDVSKYANRSTNSDKAFIDGIKTLSDINDGNNQAELVKIYGMVRRGMNGSAMSMLSAPSDKTVRDQNIHKENERPFISWLNGDIFLQKRNFASIEAHYKDFLSLNIDFQVPHHGSKENLNRLPKVLGKMRTYIWAGKENKYNHPSKKIQKMLKKAGLQDKPITEKDSHIIHHEEWI